MTLQFKKDNYLRRLIDSDDPASVKRFTVLAVLFHYIITCFAALFMSKSIANLELVSMITQYNFLIILVGIFGLTIETVGAIMLKKAEVMVNAAPPINVQNAENVSTETTTAKTLNAENVETVNTNTTNVAAKKEEQLDI